MGAFTQKNKFVQGILKMATSFYAYFPIDIQIPRVDSVQLDSLEDPTQAS